MMLKLLSPNKMIVGLCLVLVAVIGLNTVNARDMSAFEINPGTAIVDELATGGQHLYLFDTTTANSMLVVVESFLVENGPYMNLQNLGNGESVAATRQPSTGMCLRLPPGQKNYMLELTQSGFNSMGEPYGVMVWPISPERNMDCPEDGLRSTIGAANVDALLAAGGGTFSLLDGTMNFFDGDPNNPGTPVVIDPDPNGPGNGGTGDCVVNPNGPLNVNVRSRPSTRGSILGSLTGQVGGQVLNTLGDGTWLNVQAGTVNGWVASAVVGSDGICVDVPVVDLVDGEIIGLDGVTLDVTGALGNMDLALGLGIDPNSGISISTVLGELLKLDAGLLRQYGILDIDATLGKITLLDGRVLDVNSLASLNVLRNSNGTSLLDAVVGGSNGLVDVSVLNNGEQGLIDANLGEDGLNLGLAGDTLINVGGDGDGSLINIGGDGDGSLINVGGDGDGGLINVGGDGGLINVGGDGDGDGSGDLVCLPIIGCL